MRTYLLPAVFVTLTLIMLSIQNVYAQPCAIFGFFEKPLPNSPPCIDTLVGPGAKPLSYYVGLLVAAFIALIVAVGIVMIVIGGFLYMTAGGSGDRVKMAKEIIISAIVGMVLALAAWIILYTFSPQFLSPSL